MDGEGHSNSTTQMTHPLSRGTIWASISLGTRRNSTLVCALACAQSACRDGGWRGIQVLTSSPASPFSPGGPGSPGSPWSRVDRLRMTASPSIHEAHPILSGLMSPHLTSSPGGPELPGLPASPSAPASPWGGSGVMDAWFKVPYSESHIMAQRLCSVTLTRATPTSSGRVLASQDPSSQPQLQP